MKLSTRELELLKYALGFATMNSLIEADTVQYALLKMKVEKALAQVCRHCNGTRFIRNDKMEFIKCEHCKSTK